MANAIHAQGTLLQRGDGATPEVFTTVAEVGSIAGPSLQADLIDVTNHSSPSRYREYIQGLKDGGELTFDLNYNPNDATHNATTGVLADWNSGARKNYRLQFPSTPAVFWNFQVIVTNFEMNADVAEQLKAAVTMKLTAAPTLV